MPGGWHYMQHYQGKLWRVDADSIDGLYDAVLQFRLDHGLAAATWKDDVDNQICLKFPQQCRNAPLVFAPSVPAGPRLIDKVAAWADRIMRSKRVYVGPEEAQRRAAICRSCPKNINWEHECPTCVTNARRLLGICRENRDVSQSDHIKCCDVDAQDNRTAVWLDRSLLGSGEGRDARCWLR